LGSKKCLLLPIVFADLFRTEKKKRGKKEEKGGGVSASFKLPTDPIHRGKRKRKEKGGGAWAWGPFFLSKVRIGGKKGGKRGGGEKEREGGTEPSYSEKYPFFLYMYFAPMPVG